MGERWPDSRSACLNGLACETDLDTIINNTWHGSNNHCPFGPLLPNEARTLPGKLVPSLLPSYPDAAQGIETVLLPTKQARTHSPGLRPREKAELAT